MKFVLAAMVFFALPTMVRGADLTNKINTIEVVTNVNVVLVGVLKESAKRAESNVSIYHYDFLVGKVIKDRIPFGIHNGDKIQILDYKRTQYFNGSQIKSLSEFIGKKVIIVLNCTIQSHLKCSIPANTLFSVTDDIENMKRKIHMANVLVSCWANHFNNNNFRNSSLEEQVLRLIIELEYPHTGQEAANMLITLGEPAVPYIVKFMKNFRVYPDYVLKLQNPSGFFEKNRLYYPEKIIDVLSGVLNQITGYSFGFIYNGSKYPSERLAVLRAWRAYVYLKWRSKGSLHSKKCDY